MTPPTGTIVPVVTAADENYAPHAAAMLHSLVSNNPDLNIRVYFLHRPEMDAAVLARLAETAAQLGAAWQAVPVEPTWLPSIISLQHYPQEAWYRLILPSLLADVPRALWLDSDALVLGSIADLWTQDLGEHLLAAVPNALSRRFAGHAEKLNVTTTHQQRYFNTGVMLMDLAGMRAAGIEQQLNQALEQAREHIVWADQDVFNPVFAHRYLPLPLYWNAMSGMYYYVRENLRVHGRNNVLQAMRAPRIVHFTLPWLKPWRFECFHPYREAYFAHRRAAGWGEVVFQRRPWKHRIGRRMPMLLRALIHSLRMGAFAQIFALLSIGLQRRLPVAKKPAEVGGH